MDRVTSRARRRLLHRRRRDPSFRLRGCARTRGARGSRRKGRVRRRADEHDQSCRRPSARAGTQVAEHARQLTLAITVCPARNRARRRRCGVDVAGHQIIGVPVNATRVPSVESQTRRGLRTRYRSKRYSRAASRRSRGRAVHVEHPFISGTSARSSQARVATVGGDRSRRAILRPCIPFEEAHADRRRADDVARTCRTPFVSPRRDSTHHVNATRVHPPRSPVPRASAAGNAARIGTTSG